MIVSDGIEFVNAGPVDKVAALIRDVNGHGTWNRTLQVSTVVTLIPCSTKHIYAEVVTFEAV